jgi:hypothetical protein
VQEGRVRADPKTVRDKAELLRLAAELRNVTRACATIGFSRDSFYRLRKRFQAGGVQGLENASRRQPNPKNRVDPKIEAAVVSLALDQPGWGRARVASALARRHLVISPAGIRCVWLRHNLETKKKRLESRDARVFSAPRPPAPSATDPSG